jgi:hypothetical protein
VAVKTSTSGYSRRSREVMLQIVTLLWAHSKKTSENVKSGSMNRLFLPKEHTCHNLSDAEQTRRWSDPVASENYNPGDW